MDATQTISHYEHSDVQYPTQPDRRDADAQSATLEPVDLVPPRAILIAVVMGAALWGLIIGAGWLIFH
jgi:hypothetical protein